MSEGASVYETISRRLFSFARSRLSTVRDDPPLADIYLRSEREGATADDIVALEREARVLARDSHGSLSRPARSQAASVVEVCLAIRREQGDPYEANIYVGLFANFFCIAKAAKEGQQALARYNANSTDGRSQMAEVIRAASEWCREYGDVEAGHLARLTELIQNDEASR